MNVVPTDDRQLLATPTRQSPVAVIFIALRFLRNLGAVNIVVALVVIGSGRLSGGLLGIGVLAAVVGLVFTILAWWRFVFTVEGDELLVSKGVVAQERLTIPLDRVQSVSIDQRLLHRVIGLVSVSVDTAGSSEAELEIDAVDRRRAEALQRLAAGATTGDATRTAEGSSAFGAGVTAAAAEPEETLVARTPIELVRIGVARWPWAGLAALAPLIAFAGEIGELLPVDIDGESLIEDNVPNEVGRDQAVAIVGFVVAGLVIGALLGIALQVVRQLVTDWELRLLRTSTGLRRTAGLFSRTSRASTLSRVQAVRVEETPMQRAFGFGRLSLPTIGQGDLVVPGATPVECADIRQLVLAGSLEAAPAVRAAGDLNGDPRAGLDGRPEGGAGAVPDIVLDRRISPAFIFLAVRNQALFLLPVTVIVVATLGWWGLLVLLAVPLRWLTARRQWRLRRWGLTRDLASERLELVNRVTGEVPLLKAQTVQVRQSFFERRRGLATVRFNTADGHLAVPLIPLAEAEAARDLALFRVESDHRPWM